jgi:CubicO group peptidase (beta-lactamase class C family)
MRQLPLKILTLFLISCSVIQASFAQPPTVVVVDEAHVKARLSFGEYPASIILLRSFDRMFPIAHVQPGPAATDLGSPARPFDIAYEFAGKQRNLDDLMTRTYGNALVILKNGKIVAERYRNGADQHTVFTTMSISKSIVSMLVGIALERKEIASIDDMATRYAPEFVGTAYDKVTIRHLLLMRSGTKFSDEDGNEPPEYFDKVIGKNVMRCADYGRIVPRAHAPGTEFSYSSLDTCVLGRVLERATRSPLNEYMQTHLWRPAGMNDSAYWVLDGPVGIGEAISHGGLNTTARDLARIGQLMLDKGRAMGKQIVPAAWVAQSTATDGNPSKPNREGYGFQWWTDDGRYSGFGSLGQAVYVLPEENIVVAKFSSYPMDAGDSARQEEAVALRAIAQKKD